MMGKKGVLLVITCIGILLISGCMAKMTKEDDGRINPTNNVKSNVETEAGAQEERDKEQEYMQSYNTAFVEYLSRDIIGLIINEPTDEELGRIESLDRYSHEKDRERMLIIPKHRDTQVTIQAVVYGEEKLELGEVLYDVQVKSDGYGLLLETVRPEGIPRIMLTLRHGDEKVEYLVAYDGKNGTPPTEYLGLEIQATEESIDGEGANEDQTNENEQIDKDNATQADLLYIGETVEVLPREEAEYLQGLNLIEKREMDSDFDGINEVLEIYCNAEVDEEGNLVMDDGQMWSVIVRKDDKIYPVLEPTFIQMGTIQSKVYIDYGYEDEQSTCHLMITRMQSAGMSIYDAWYNQEKDLFEIKQVYRTTGNVGFLEW